MKSIIFDLGGVLFARDPSKVASEVIEFFSFITDKKMPEFWEEYDRGTRTLAQTIEHLCQTKGCSKELCEEYIKITIETQEPIPATEALVRELKQRGYKLYVLSNMSRDYIAMLRRHDVYKLFDGEVVSCEQGSVKPEEAIYKILLERFELDPAESLFVDDRPENIETARRLGINGYQFVTARAKECCDEIRALL
ncbi:MAG: HAD family phosphatase [Rikenellaceae bacterium]